MYSLCIQIRLSASGNQLLQVRVGLLQPFLLLTLSTKEHLLKSLYCTACYSRMEETTPLEWSMSALVISLVVLLVEGDECGELVLPSLPPPGWRRREEEELVCGTAPIGRQNSPAVAESTWSEGGEEQGGGRDKGWQHDLPFKVEDNICSEPPLEVDSEMEPQTVAVQESAQT